MEWEEGKQEGEKRKDRIIFILAGALIASLALTGFIYWTKSSGDTSADQWATISTNGDKVANNNEKPQTGTVNNTQLSNSNVNEIKPVTMATVTVWMRSCGDGCNEAVGDSDWQNGIVILKTTRGELRSKTNSKGRASFSNVPCGKVVVTFEPAFFGEKYNRVVPCNTSQVNLGNFMVGDPAV